MAAPPRSLSTARCWARILSKCNPTHPLTKTCLRAPWRCSLTPTVSVFSPLPQKNPPRCASTTAPVALHPTPRTELGGCLWILQRPLQTPSLWTSRAREAQQFTACATPWRTKIAARTTRPHQGPAPLRRARSCEKRAASPLTRSWRTSRAGSAFVFPHRRVTSKSRRGGALAAKDVA